jgi:hypothetical protein
MTTSVLCSRGSTLHWLGDLYHVFGDLKKSRAAYEQVNLCL